MARAKKSIEAGLLAKGFECRDGDHNDFIYWTVDGKKSMAKTKTSRG